MVCGQSELHSSDWPQTNAIISAARVMKARNHMCINLCSFCRKTVWDLVFYPEDGGRTWRWNFGTHLPNYLASRTRGQHLQISDWRCYRSIDHCFITGSFRKSTDCKMSVKLCNLPLRTSKHKYMLNKLLCCYKHSGQTFGLESH
jgi:hypothetical protein